SPREEIDRLVGLLRRDGKVLIPRKFYNYAGVREGLYIVKNHEGWGTWNSESGIVLPCKYNVLTAVNDSILITAKDRKWRLLKENGEVIVSGEFLEMKKSRKGKVFFKKENSSGIMRLDGTVMFEGPFEKVEETNGWVQVWKNKGTGISRLSGETIVPAIYAEVEIVRGDRIQVRGRGGYGILDSTGKRLVVPRYRKITTLKESGGFLVEGEGVSILDSAGKRTAICGVQKIYDFKGSLATFKKNGKVGLTNVRGALLIPPQYDRIELMEGVARTWQGNQPKIFYFSDQGEESKKKRFMLVRGKGETEEATPRRRRNRQNWNGDFAGRAFATPQGWFYDAAANAYGLLDLEADTLRIPPIYDEIHIVSERMTCVGRLRNERVLFGMVDHVRAKQVLRPSLTEIKWTDFKYANVVAGPLVNGRHVLVRPNGKIINSKSIRFVGKYHDGMARVMMGGKLKWKQKEALHYLVDRRIQRDGRTVREFQYPTGGKWGFLLPTGKWAKKPDFDFVTDFHDGLAFFREGKKWGVIDTNFNVVVKPHLDEITHLRIPRRGVLIRSGVNGG
ncbi:MAG: WG repeat-containing protein, partial [Bacteroidota bacterium]